MRSVRPTSFARQILFKGVSEKVGVFALAGNDIPVNRCHTADAGSAEVGSCQRAGIVGCDPRDPRVPTQAIAGARLVTVLFHFDPKHRQFVIDKFAAHGPKPFR